MENYKKLNKNKFKKYMNKNKLKLRINLIISKIY